MKITQNNVFPVGDQTVQAFHLENSHHVQIEILDLGLTISRLLVPDKFGQLRDIALGFADYKDYIKNEPSFGATIGRFANRIAKGQFDFQGKTYRLEKNDGNNHLHGGSNGFSHRIWQLEKDDPAELTFRLESPDGEDGYPGDLICHVSFLLTDDNTLTIRYLAETSSITFANLTNHTYFNLNGEASGTILDQKLQINAKSFTESDSELIPTGRFLTVANTPMDFCRAKSIGEDIKKHYLPLEQAGGYDHNFVLDKEADYAAKAYSKKSGIELTLKTNCPGVQLYTSNFLDGSIMGKSQVKYQKHAGFCLETQYYPDAPNQPGFPQPLVRKEQPLRLETSYQFSIKK